MDIKVIQPRWRIEKIEKHVFIAERPRKAGCNARLGEHGKYTDFQCVRITIEGQCGFGWSKIQKDKAKSFIGIYVKDMFNEEGLLKEDFHDIEYPLMDWLGKVSGKPVYELIGKYNIESRSFSTLCYDSNLYFDELHIQDDIEAAEFIQKEVMENWKKGHRAFKIKIGRGARHMPFAAGMKRDILIVNKVREVIGPDVVLMVDANNSLNLNLTKEFLEATADARLEWIEEPFFEDDVLYNDLKKWMYKNGLNVKIADGEGFASPRILEWARDGYIDVIQFDASYYGFSKWLKLGQMLDSMNVKSAPHNYSGYHGSFTSGHLAAAIKGFTFVEFDESYVTGVDNSGYYIENGRLFIPDVPGFGLELDNDIYTKGVAENGWSITL